MQPRQSLAMRYRACKGDAEMKALTRVAGYVLSGPLRHFVERRGGSAVEFAIVAPIFLVFILMILETGLIIFTQATLDNATRDAARLIQIGSVQQAGGSATPFTSQLCADVSPLISCASLAYHVQSGSTFAALSPTITIDGSGNMTSTGFSPGGSGQDVLIQVGYNRAFFVYWVGSLISSKSTLLLSSTVALQVEPY